MHTRLNALPRWARALDAIVVVLLFLALYVAIEGGFVVAPAGLRLSVRSAWRPLGWAVGLALVRHFFVRTPPLHRRLTDLVLDASHAAGPLRDDYAPQVWRGAAPPRPGGTLTYTVGAAAVVVLYALLTAAMTYPQVAQLSTAVAVNEGDALFSTWRLSWIAHQLPIDPLRLFHGNIFHPEPFTLAFSDSVIVPGLMAAPLLWLGVPALTAYNIIFLSAFVLSGAGMFLLVRSLTQHTAAALLAGFVFAFLPYRYMHYAHLELQVAQWMPLCLWALHRTLGTGRLSDGLLTGAFFALQALSSWYYGIFLATYLVPVAGALLLGGTLAHRWATTRALAAGAVLAAVLVVPMTIPYFAARESVGERPPDEVQFYSATPINYLAAHPQNVVFGSVTSRWGGQERELFMGFVVPLVALIGLWPPLSAARIAYGLGLIVAFDISLGFNGLLYPWLHSLVLPYRGLRVPARMAMLVGLSLAILAGYGVARIARTRKGPASRAALAAIAVAFAVEYYSRPELKAMPTAPPPIYELLPAQSPVVLLELPLLQPDIAIEPLFMYYSTFHWRPLVNGYSGFSPPSYRGVLDAAATLPDAAALATLRRHGVTHIVVHGELMPRHRYVALVDRLDGCRQLDRLAAVAWRRHELRLYRLLDTGPSCAVSTP